MTQVKDIITIVCLAMLAACSWVELPPPRSDVRDVIADEALAQVDRPYRYQGADPTGFDTSGLVQHVFGRAGVELPHSVEGQHAQGSVISFNRIRHGDLLFYQLDESPHRQPHVGIYIGRSRMVHITENDRVRVEVIDTPYWQRRRLDAVSYLP